MVKLAQAQNSDDVEWKRRERSDAEHLPNLAIQLRLRQDAKGADIVILNLFSRA